MLSNTQLIVTRKLHQLSQTSFIFFQSSSTFLLQMNEEKKILSRSNLHQL